MTADYRASLGWTDEGVRPYVVSDRCYLVKIFDVRARRAVNALHVWILGFDDVVLIGRMSAAAVAHSEVAGRHAQRVAGENISGPRSRAARQDYGIDPLA